MTTTTDEENALCFGCVYYPPNLPHHAYAQADWDMLQAKSCSFELEPASPHCLANRKTSCSLVDLTPKTTSP